MSEALTQKDSMSRLMVEPVEAERLDGCQVRRSKGWSAEGAKLEVAKHVNSRWQEKVLTIV